MNIVASLLQISTGLALLTGPSFSAAPVAPQIFMLDAADLVAARARLASGDRSLQPALAKLLAEAEKTLTLRPPTVMTKTLTAASGDKHDYLSFGPYWWPDPSKPDGLPYIRRDGEVNPTSREGADDDALETLCLATETLGLAYWFTGDERFAEKAIQLVRVWFLDPATRMNPNLQHAQAIPGITTGRGIGIIGSRRLTLLNDGLALLGNSPAWTAPERTAFRAWLGEFYHWLTTSKNGQDERGELNNHGTWYDVQVAHLALVLDRPEEAKKILAEGLTRRLASEVQPDGSQPLELARTKSLDYSLMNLEALFTCAQLAGPLGVDWWGFRTADGRSLRAALAYLAPYVDPARPWPKHDLHAADRSRLVGLLDQFLRHGEDPALRKLFGEFTATSAADARWRLIRNKPLSAR